MRVSSVTRLRKWPRICKLMRLNSASWPSTLKWSHSYRSTIHRSQSSLDILGKLISWNGNLNDAGYLSFNFMKYCVQTWEECPGYMDVLNWFLFFANIHTGLLTNLLFRPELPSPGCTRDCQSSWIVLASRRYRLFPGTPVIVSHPAWCRPTRIVIDIVHFRIHFEFQSSRLV